MSKTFTGVKLDDILIFNSGNSGISIPDNSATSLTIAEGANTYFNIDTTDGSELISIQQPLQYTGSAPTDGYVLTSDASGNVTWALGGVPGITNTTGSFGLDTIQVSGSELSLMMSNVANLGEDTSGNARNVTVSNATQVTNIDDGSILQATAANFTVDTGSIDFNAVISAINTSTITTFSFWTYYPSPGVSGKVDYFVNLYSDDNIFTDTHFYIRYVHSTTRIEFYINNNNTITVDAYLVLDITDGNWRKIGRAHV